MENVSVSFRYRIIVEYPSGFGTKNSNVELFLPCANSFFPAVPFLAANLSHEDYP